MVWEPKHLFSHSFKVSNGKTMSVWVPLIFGLQLHVQGKKYLLLHIVYVAAPPFSELAYSYSKLVQRTGKPINESGPCGI